MSTPCNGRPAQEQQASANIKAPATRKSLGVLEAVTPLRTWPMLARKVQQTQDNSRSPDVDQTIDFNPFREARKILCTTFGPFDPSKSIAAGNKGICKAAGWHQCRLLVVRLIDDVRSLGKKRKSLLNAPRSFDPELAISITPGRARSRSRLEPSCCHFQALYLFVHLLGVLVALHELRFFGYIVAAQLVEHFADGEFIYFGHRNLLPRQQCARTQA
jgi:hypothetical protein